MVSVLDKDHCLGARTVAMVYCVNHTDNIPIKNTSFKYNKLCHVT